MCSPWYPFQGHALSFLLKTKVVVHQIFVNKKVVFIDLWNTVPHTFIFTFVQDNQKWKVVTKNNTDNPRFVDDETIPLVQDEDYSDCNRLDTSRVDETSFTEPDTTEATSILQLRQKVKQDKITALYRHLNVTGEPGPANIDQFMIKKISKNRQHWLAFSRW